MHSEISQCGFGLTQDSPLSKTSTHHFLNGPDIFRLLAKSFLPPRICFLFPLFFVSLVEKKEAPVSVSQLAYSIPTGTVIGSKMIKWSLSGQWELNSGSAMEKEKLQLSGMWNWGMRSGAIERSQAVWEWSPTQRRAEQRVMVKLSAFLIKPLAPAEPDYSPASLLPMSMTPLSVKPVWTEFWLNCPEASNW